MTGDEAMRAAESVPAREETFQSSSTGYGIPDAWCSKTTDEPEAMSIYDMTMQASGLSFATKTAPVDCVGCQGILFRFVKVFLTWKIDMIGQGGLGSEQHGSRRRAAQGWASIGARH